MNICKREANISNGIDDRIENTKGFEIGRNESIKLGCRSAREADHIGSSFRDLRNRPDRRYTVLCVLDVDLNWLVIA